MTTFRKLIIAAVVMVVAIIAIRLVMKFARVTRPIKRRECDSDGCGNFGASRTGHVHKGQDFLAQPGANAYAPISGRVRLFKAYAGDDRFDGVEITGVRSRVKVMYILPAVKNGSYVVFGTKIGEVQDLSIKYGTIANHTHVEVYRGGKAVDPSPLFPNDDILPKIFA